MNCRLRCDLLRSGCSRGIHHGAPLPPRWQARERDARPRGPAPSAARRLVVCVHRCAMRTSTCRPRFPDVLGQPMSRIRAAHRVDYASGVAGLRPRNVRDGIEIDAQLVRMVEIIRAHRMGMQFETREIGHPCKVRRMPRHGFVGASSDGKRISSHFDPRRLIFSARASGKRTLTDAVGKANEDIGTIARASQRAVGDSEVVHDIQLGVPGGSCK